MDYTVVFNAPKDEVENDIRKKIAAAIAQGVSDSKLNITILSGYFTDSNGKQLRLRFISKATKS